MLTLWFFASVLFIAAELVVPGQVAMGLGMGGLVVSLGLWLGLIESWPSAIVVWLFAAPPFVLAMRAVFHRFMPGEIETVSTDEDAPLMGRVVMVVDVNETGTEGRVAFGDSSWPAISAEGRLEPGLPAQLLMRDGLYWVVKPIRTAETASPGRTDPMEPPTGHAPETNHP